LGEKTLGEVLVLSLVPKGEISADETRTAERERGALPCSVCAAMISILKLILKFLKITSN
jgi:hypothetical protein